MFENSAARRSSVKNDLLSGVTVALALVPEAVAFALIAGVDPLVGLYAAFMVGLITVIAGGQPGMINVNSGGRGRLSGVTAALSLLTFILFASSLIEQIPIAALIGVMFIVVIGTFEWSSFRIIRRIPKQDAFVLITVSAVTVVTDLAIAVVVGVIISALVFAWNHAKEVRVEKRENRYGSHYYTVHGPLFFGSTASFSEHFTPRDDNNDVIIDFADSRVCDHSGIEAIDSLAMRYKRNGRTLHLIHLSPECKKLLKKAGDMVELNVVEDPKYFVATESAKWDKLQSTAQ